MTPTTSAEALRFEPISKDAAKTLDGIAAHMRANGMPNADRVDAMHQLGRFLEDIAKHMRVKGQPSATRSDALQVLVKERLRTVSPEVNAPV